MHRNVPVPTHKSQTVNPWNSVIMTSIRYQTLKAHKHISLASHTHAKYNNMHTEFTGKITNRTCRIKNTLNMQPIRERLAFMWLWILCSGWCVLCSNMLLLLLLLITPLVAYDLDFFFSSTGIRTMKIEYVDVYIPIYIYYIGIYWYAICILLLQTGSNIPIDINILSQSLILNNVTRVYQHQLIRSIYEWSNAQSQSYDVCHAILCRAQAYSVVCMSCQAIYHSISLYM